MKLRQNQVWKQGDEFLRIVALERLEVQYKNVTNPATGERKHHRVTKKEFCRLIKGAKLLAPAEEADLRTEERRPQCVRGFRASRIAAMMKRPAAAQMHESATLNAGHGFAKRTCKSTRRKSTT